MPGDYGTTFFPFLLRGYGGRERGLSGAFAAVADDITTLEANPAGTASLQYTELFFAHNKLMGDVNYNSLAFAMRLNDLGFGVGARVLYTPFTHFNSVGENVGSGVITYSVFTFNIAYNFLRTYKFFGLSIGGNVKLYVLGVPGSIAKNQSIANVAFDFGFLTRFNFLKAYKRKDKNFSFGIVVRNLGPFTDGEPPPTQVCAAVSYKPIEQLLITTDFNMMINYSRLSYKNIQINAGLEWRFTKYSSILAGVVVRSNPSFSLGLNLSFEDFTVTAVYCPDFVDVFQFSVSGSLKFGDLGRKTKEVYLKKMYSTALRLINEGKLEAAKDILEQILKKDRGFNLARTRLEFVKKQIILEEELKKLQNKDKTLE